MVSAMNGTANMELNKHTEREKKRTRGTKPIGEKSNIYELGTSHDANEINLVPQIDVVNNFAASTSAELLLVCIKTHIQIGI